jgi:hypothetical protein
MAWVALSVIVIGSGKVTLTGRYCKCRCMFLLQNKCKDRGD